MAVKSFRDKIRWKVFCLPTNVKDILHNEHVELFKVM